ncbi:MAG TPA: hypothetical protein VKA68_18585, partial [bacterium]|nr:hypothetical protein [bacterium]
MTNIKDVMRRRPVLIYFVLTFAISWGGIFLVIGPGGILGTREVSDGLMPLVYLATLVGPSVSGLLMIGVVDGPAGFRELLSRLRRWQIGTRWYAVVLLTAPLLITATLLVLSRTSPAFLPVIFGTEDKLNLLVIGIVMGVSVGFFEEL